MYPSKVGKGTLNSPLRGGGVKAFDHSGLQYMTDQARGGARRWRRLGLAALGMAALAGTAACAGHTPQIPMPRPIVNFAGVRIRASRARMDSVDRWVTKEADNIKKDPTFMVISNPASKNVYPWEHMRMSHDTVVVLFDPLVPETQLPFEIYGHLHLMAQMGRLGEFLPAAAHDTGFDLERAILSRVADAWLLARTVYDAAPYPPLDELIYAKEAGYLDAFIFTARPDHFADARAKWAEENPGRSKEYRTWFLKTFNREPPGLRNGE